MKTENFKAGDIVRLRDGLIKGNKYGGLIMSKFMFFDGYKIVDMSLFEGHCIEGWYYSPEMLTL